MFSVTHSYYILFILVDKEMDAIRRKAKEKIAEQKKKEEGRISALFADAEKDVAKKHPALVAKMKSNREKLEAEKADEDTSEVTESEKKMLEKKACQEPTSDESRTAGWKLVTIRSKEESNQDIRARTTNHFPKATKPSPGCKLGLGFKGGFPLKVGSISPDSIFAGTDLAVGMEIEKINGKRYYTPLDGISLLKGAKKTVKVTASMLHPSALPSPWRKIFDANTERTYYHNPQTNKSQWERPM